MGNCTVFAGFLFIIHVSVTAITAGVSIPAPSIPFRETVVFTAGEGGYNTFRIPAIIKAPNGHLLAFCEGRVSGASDFGNMDIVMKRSADNGVTWSALSVAAEFGTLQAGNPVPLVDKSDPRFPGGRIFLHYCTGTQSESTILSGSGVREIRFRTSSDNGSTWTTPVNITLSVHKPNEPSVNAAYSFTEDWRWYATGPCHGIQLSSGRLVVPAGHTVGAGYTEDRSHIYYSDDHGSTWKLGGSASINTNESSVVELVNRDLMLNMRRINITNHRRGVAVSHTAGLSWDSTYSDTALIEPLCQGAVLRYTDTTLFRKNRLLFSNPRSTSGRTNMTVQMSYDEGKSWPVRREVYSGASAYSDLVVADSMMVGLLYEKDSYAKISFACMTLSWLSNGADSLDRKPNTGTQTVPPYAGVSMVMFFRDRCRIEATGPGPCIVTCMTLDGRVVVRTKYRLVKGTNILPFTAPARSAGVIVAKVEMGNETSIRRVW